MRIPKCDNSKEPAVTRFMSPKQYVKAKLKMLRNEMYIEPSGSEVAHLFELKSEIEIDQAVHSIIDRRWSK